MHWNDYPIGYVIIQSMRSLLLGMIWFYVDVITQPFKHSRKDLKDKPLMTKHEFFSHALNSHINNYKKSLNLIILDLQHQPIR